MADKEKKSAGVDYSIDDGKIESYANLQIAKHFPSLKKLRILYTFRSKPRKDEGGHVAAVAKRLSTKLRDILNKDVEIEVCQPIWKSLQREGKRKLMWHELYHIIVEKDEEGRVKRDSSGRVKVKLRRHNLVVKTFVEEIEKFGTDPGYEPHIEVLKKGLKKGEQEVD